MHLPLMCPWCAAPATDIGHRPRNADSTCTPAKAWVQGKVTKLPAGQADVLCRKALTKSGCSLLHL